MSDSVQPHRQQPTRLPRPWDSPGKNTGVGCHFLLQCMKVQSESEAAQSCLTLSDPMDCSLPGSSIHGIFQATVLESGAIAFSASKKHSVRGNKNISLSVAAVQSFSDVTATFWPREGSKDKATRTKSHQIPSRPQKQVETVVAIVSSTDITATVINLQLRCTAQLMRRANLWVLCNFQQKLS